MEDFDRTAHSCPAWQQGPVSLKIYAEFTDHSAPLDSIVRSLSERVRTAFFVNWSPPDWPADTAVQMSPDISSLIAVSATVHPFVTFITHLP